MIDRAEHDPQVGIERRLAARHLLMSPLTCEEHDPDLFRLIRRHEVDLDRWFTQRLGYRLHVDSDTARLFKMGGVPDRRPLRTHTDRPFTRLEYVILALVLGTTVAGPSIVSLRDLVDGIRSAGAEAEIRLAGDATERRAIVSVLRWMIEHGLAMEMHERIEAYAADEDADAVLRIRPDRITLLPLPALVGAESATTMLGRAEQRDATRQWMRRRLTEEPVLYRDDLTDAEWAELRRRLGEEERLADEMFGMVIEARAEGVATIDPDGWLTGTRFPAGGTVRHAALLLIERLALRDPPDTWFNIDEVERIVSTLIEANTRRWANQMVESPHRLTTAVVTLLADMRMVETDTDRVRLRPLAARFVAVENEGPDHAVTETLW